MAWSKALICSQRKLFKNLSFFLTEFWLTDVNRVEFCVVVFKTAMACCCFVVCWLFVVVCQILCRLYCFTGISAKIEWVCLFWVVFFLFCIKIFLLLRTNECVWDSSRVKYLMYCSAFVFSATYDSHRQRCKLCFLFHGPDSWKSWGKTTINPEFWWTSDLVFNGASSFVTKAIS